MAVLVPRDGPSRTRAAARGILVRQRRGCKGADRSTRGLVMIEERPFEKIAERSATWHSHVGIPVRNLWTLLVYASGLARFLNPFTAQVDGDAALPDVLGQLLAFAVERRLRRNLSRNYQRRSGELSRVRGRIDWMKTEAGMLLSRGKVACRFEELTHNTPRNRLILAALVRARTDVEDTELSFRCGSLVTTLLDAGVSPIPPSRSEISRDRIGRNDADDELVVRVAELVLEIKLPSEKAGDVKVTRLDHDERLLRQIFEKAVAEFYRHEFHGRDGWKVSSQTRFGWDAIDATEGLDAILPKMNADVVLQQGVARRLVLDTKFTGILTHRPHGSEGLKSAHLYQLYSYIRSQAGRGDVAADCAEGILLHPSLERHVDEAVTIQGHRLRFVTIDLASEPEKFRRDLIEIVKTRR
ncbi:5-methylcytosine-specific restriction endonuclease system specificity protein McrC [Rhizobium leguminosarum]|nr:5-methylcytosine-specific restriction endonuclease system specificity protein McrC [Rhizobium leguminosarum]